MNLYVELKSLNLKNAPGDQREIKIINAKRGDSLPLAVRFYKGTEQVRLDPTTTITFVLKENGKHDSSALVLDSSFTASAVGTPDADPHYTATPSLNTTALNALFLINDDPSDDPPLLDLMGELSWQAAGDAGPTTIKTFTARVENDIYRGTEGTPLEDPDPADWLDGQNESRGISPIRSGQEYLFPDDISISGDIILDGSAITKEDLTFEDIDANDYHYWTANTAGGVNLTLSYNNILSQWELEASDGVNTSTYTGISTKSDPRGVILSLDGVADITVGASDGSPGPNLGDRGYLTITGQWLEWDGSNWVDAKKDLERIENYEAYKLRRQLRLKTNGDREAETYATTHNLDNNATGRIANFLTGLEEIGIKGDFYDAGLYSAKYQPSSGSTAYSLLGNSDLAITGTPVRKKHGFFFQNDSATSPTSPERMFGDVSSSGEWTWVTSDARQVYGSTVGQRRALNALTPTPYSAFIQMQNGTNWQTYTYAGGGVSNINGVKSPIEDAYKPIITKNAAVSASSSLQTRSFGGSWLSTTGRGNVPLSKLTIGAGTTNGFSFSQYYDGLSNYWMLFNSLVDNSALEELEVLIEETIAPKYRFVFEGDSISSDSIGWAYHVLSDPTFMCCNIDLVSQGTGGFATPQLVNRIGTSTGINDTFASSDIPVFAVIQAGTNDPGQAPDAEVTYTSGAAETHANIRLLWHSARARGMKVVACTMPKATIYDAGGSAEYWTTGTSGELSLDVVDQVNALIRADSDRYDYLLDVDNILTGEFGATYWQDTSCFSDGIHPGTSQASAGPPVISMLSRILDLEII